MVECLRDAAKGTLILAGLRYGDHSWATTAALRRRGLALRDWEDDEDDSLIPKSEFIAITPAGLAALKEIDDAK